MIEVNKSIKVLAVFEPGKPPRPYKFKVKEDFRNEEHEVYIDEVTNVDTRSLQFILFHCVSHYESTSKRYILQLMRKDLSWKLYKSE